MHAMVDRSRTPLGHSAPASLLELGYTRACALPLRPPLACGTAPMPALSPQQR